MRSFVRIFLFLLFLAAVAAAIGYAFWPQPLAVELAPAVRDRLTVTVDEDGKTRVKERYVVSAPLAGRLSRITLKAGAPVQAGETLLATLEPLEPELLDPRTLALAQAKVSAAKSTLARTGPLRERASAELEHATKELERVRGLAPRKVISPDRLDDAEMLFRAREQDLKAAQFAEEIARFELQWAEAALARGSSAPASSADNGPLEIHSPVTGQVLRVLQESAATVAAGARLLELGDPEDLEVEVDVLSSDAVKIRPGARVWIEQWGGEKPLTARVRLVEPSAFMKISALGVEEQRVNVILDFPPGERPPTLADAFRVEARIVIWEQDQILQIPTGALFRRGDQWAVFVAQDARAGMQIIELGQRNSLQAQVLDGLQEGEQVILHPSDKVRHGVRVTPRDVVTVHGS